MKSTKIILMEHYRCPAGGGAITSMFAYQASTQILTRKRIGPLLPYLPWDLVSKKCVFGHRKCWIPLDGWPKRTRLLRFHKKIVSVWTGPKSDALCGAMHNVGITGYIQNNTTHVQPTCSVKRNNNRKEPSCSPTLGA